MVTKTTTLYWIRLKSHTDIKTQGYVGVSTSVKGRLSDHKSGYSGVLARAGVPWEELVVDEFQIPFNTHALFEKALRPTENIGWNDHVGGLGEGRPLGSGLSIANKLTDTQRSAIVMEYATGKTSYEKLGKKYGVRGESIRYTIKSWAPKQTVFA